MTFTKPLLLGHRGAPHQARENTLEAFRRALAVHPFLPGLKSRVDALHPEVRHCTVRWRPARRRSCGRGTDVASRLGEGDGQFRRRRGRLRAHRLHQHGGDSRQPWGRHPRY